jgi:hypothetical protein
MVRRPSLSLLLVLAAAVCGASGASAQDRPGECVTRRVTGPGGAYRWDRVECEAVVGWSHDPRALEVVDGPLRGDRYGGWSVAISNPGYPGRDAGSSQNGPYGAPYSTYRVAGRDAGGFLVWPGKLQ